MKGHILYAILLSAALLYSCGTADEKGREQISSDETFAMVVKPFSDSLKTDTFRLRLLGEKPKDMQLSFTITSFEGRKIYDIKIDAQELFKNYDVENLNKQKNQIQFLKDEVGRFLDDENFMEPAVTEQENPDANVPDKKFYEELKKTQLNGFSYRLGKDKKRYIAWSDKENKVKLYYSCCN